MNMKDVAIIGVGLHPWGKFPDKPWTAMAKDAIDEAMKDAGVQLEGHRLHRLRLPALGRP